MNKKILIIILIIVGLGLIIIGKKLPSASNNAINENLNSITASTTTDNTKITSYTMTDVAKNNTESSCWSAVSGKVYNLTAWISKHPGGAKNIIKICGIDFFKKDGEWIVLEINSFIFLDFNIVVFILNLIIFL